MESKRDTFRSRIQHAWNAFNRNRDPAYFDNGGPGYSHRPDRVRMNIGTERSIISAIYTRLGIDVAAIQIVHARLDADGRYIQEVASTLNDCLSVEANLDQSGRALRLDIALSLFDEGVIAVVPVDVTIDPDISTSYDILSLRTGKITQWYPTKVKVELYNEKTARKEEIILDKKVVAIVENPLYAVMNEPNSTLRRLIYKLNLLDAIDDQSGSGKLDVIIQLPYSIKSEARRELAEKRRKDIEVQLSGSKYGIAYIDGTEKVTQLNRPAVNNLMEQVEFLTSMLYSQLGLTQSIFDGTADEKTMLNYFNRTIEPVISAIVDEFNRKFLTKTARSQGQKIMFFKDPFKLVPVSDLAEIADKFTRNEILSSNEVRAVIGYKPSKDPKADELINKNISVKNEEPPVENKLKEKENKDAKVRL